MKKSIILIFVLCLLLFENSQSQDSPFYKRLSFSVEPRYGFVAPHHDYIAYFLEKNVSGIQINAGLSTFGNKGWHMSYNYPQIGLGYHHSGLGNDKIYGKMNALYLYVDRRFFPIQNRFNIGNRIAFGLSHINKQYNMHSNPYNMAISTPINFFFQYDLITYYRITPSIDIRLNVGLTHTSNGSIKEPNKGLNIITAGFGIQYILSNGRRETNMVSKNDPSATKHHVNIGVISGCKSISRFDNKLYAIIGMSGEYLFQYSSTTFFGLEITGYIDNSIKDEFKNEGDNTYSKTDNICIAINPIYALKMGHVFFTFQPGIYLKYSFNPYGLFTNKVGLRYELNQYLYASMAIKAHWFAKADFIEFGIRYNFLNR